MATKKTTKAEGKASKPKRVCASRTKANESKSKTTKSSGKGKK